MCLRIASIPSTLEIKKILQHETVATFAILLCIL